MCFDCLFPYNNIHRFFFFLKALLKWNKKACWLIALDPSCMSLIVQKKLCAKFNMEELFDLSAEGRLLHSFDVEMWNLQCMCMENLYETQMITLV